MSVDGSGTLPLEIAPDPAPGNGKCDFHRRKSLMSTTPSMPCVPSPLATSPLSVDWPRSPM